MDVATLHHRTIEAWADRVAAVGPEQWHLPTPCAQWSVRDLVNHVTGEDRWTRPLLEGRTIAEVGDRLDGDLLGDDPVAAALDAAKDAVSCVAERRGAHEQVHLSYGDEEPGEYLMQLAADHLVHAWDVAAATGGSTHLDPQLVADVGAWFGEREGLYRAAGLVGDRHPVTGDGQWDLLSAFGRPADWGPCHATLARFTAAFAAGDLDAVMALVTPDVVFESTDPAPDGVRHEGARAVRAVWQELFASTRDLSFTEEESFVAHDRALVRWRFGWADADGAEGHVRGVDVIRFRDGLVCEKLSYVKG